MSRRDELEGWIDATRRVQRRLALAMTAGLAIAIVLLIWNRAFGGIALLLLGVVAITSFWVTSSHIADWRTRLEDLARRRPSANPRVN